MSNIENRAFEEFLADKDYCFPKDHLGVGDKFILKQIIASTFRQFQDSSGNVPFRSYGFTYWVNQEMKEHGYRARDLEPLV